jgi:3-phenylpropionate/trans-cinnamate dioxygenase ferredoxin component
MYNYAKLDADELEYYEICSTDELPNGERLFIEIGEFQMVVFNIAGIFFAIADLCSHDDGPLGDGEVEDHQVICPRHGARFDIATGAVLSLPASEDIPAFPVIIEDGQIKVGVPVE